jgi:hypothetical protein
MARRESDGRRRLILIHRREYAVSGAPHVQTPLMESNQG